MRFDISHFQMSEYETLYNSSIETVEVFKGIHATSDEVGTFS